MAQKGSMELIKNKIISDSQLKAKKIIEKAEKDYRKALEEFKQEVKRKYDFLIDSAENEAKQIIERKTAETKVYVKRLLLDKKEELLQKTFMKALDKLKNTVKTERYQSFLENLIYATAKQMGGGDLEVLTNKGSKVNSTALQKISAKLSKELNTKTSIKLCKEDIKTIGGVILRNREGNIEINNTLEAILDGAKTSMRSKVAEILFG